MIVLFSLFQLWFLTEENNRHWQANILAVTLIGLIITRSAAYFIRQPLFFTSLLYLNLLLAYPNIPYYGAEIKDNLTQQLQRSYQEPYEQLKKMHTVDSELFRVFHDTENLRGNLWATKNNIDIAFEPANDPATPKYLDRYMKILLKHEDNFLVRYDLNSPLNDLFNIKYIHLSAKNQHNRNYYWVNEDPFSRFFLTHRIRPFEQEDELWEYLKIAQRDELLTTSLLTVQELDKLKNFPFLTTTSELPPSEYLKIIRRETNHIQLEAGLLKEGFLNAAETWFPLWHCQVNQRPTPLLRSYGALWSIPLGKGVSNITCVFKDEYFSLGKWVSGLTLVFCSSLLGLIYLDHRRKLKSAALP